MNEPSIYNFVNFAEYLRSAAHQYLKRSERPFTAKRWAERLGYRSPQALTMVLTGKRLPSSEMIFKLADDLNLQASEKRYFELLVHLEKFRRAGKSVKSIVQDLEALNANFSKQQPLDAATFSYISDWYHLIIEQLVGTPNFREDAAWLRARLRDKVSEQEARAALKTLERLGLLLRDDTGGLVRAQKGLATDIDVPSSAVRSHHKQMMLRAAEALDEQKVDEREMISHGLRFDRSRLAEAKAELRKFRDAFNERFYSECSNDIFQLNLQFFSHTASPTHMEFSQ